jgi:hypothetical protein
VAVLTIRVPVVLVLEAPGHDSLDPRRVPSWVSRLGRNQHPLVPCLQDPDNRPQAFCRVGGWNHSLDGRQSRDSHVTVGTIAGSSRDHGASQYDQSRDVRPESRSMTGVGTHLHYKCV